MSVLVDGGHAFPGGVDPNNGWPMYSGMTLRDWLAGQALVGLLAGAYRDTTRANFTEVPEEAYAVADAMLAARNSTPTKP